MNNTKSIDKEHGISCNNYYEHDSIAKNLLGWPSNRQNDRRMKSIAKNDRGTIIDKETGRDDYIISDLSATRKVDRRTNKPSDNLLYLTNVSFGRYETWKT